MPGRLKKGDTIIVLSGKNKGRKGKILNVIPDEGQAVVERINVVKRHQRPSRNFQGGIVEKPLPLPTSVLMLICPRCSEPTRIGGTEVEGKNVRVCKKCKEIIDKV